MDATELDPERWRRLEELFRAASELEPAERVAYLAEACGGDAALQARIEALLAAGEGAEERIEDAIRGTLDLAVRDGDVFVSWNIGPYRVLGELGRGGMSTVYLAERADEHYRKRVALKVVKPGMDTGEILARLRRERQILARLEHPNIARLLDGGNTAEGHPYFVMDYVEGEPIDLHCDRRGLSVRRRLELFLGLCAAVQYAHRSLVVHRDLKPSNLLVTAEGVPMLLDFGIAKLLDPDLSYPATATEMRLMTPEYASPEQVRGEPLTTATDIYSLGVLLFRLLAGRHPYPVDRRRRAELERAICESSPEKPSEAVGRKTQSLSAEQPGQIEGVSPERWRRSLRGDLDNIVLMALRKEPQRRYSSVEQLANDIRLHLAGRPVLARPNTWSYRSRKFVRRHRWALTAATAVIVLLVTLVSFYTVRLARERDRARQEEAKSTQVADFLRQLFMVSDPDRSLGETMTARELLDQGAWRIRAQLFEDPGLRAGLIDLMGTVYLSLGLYKESGPLLTEAFEIRRQLHGPEHPEVAQSLHHRAQWWRRSGSYEEAEQGFRTALRMRRSQLGTVHRDVADSLSGLADLLYDKGEYAEAQELFSEALTIRRRLFGTRHPDVATSLNDLAACLYEEGDSAAAEPLLREALEIQQRLFGLRHPDSATVLSTLGAVRLAQGDAEEAERLFRRVVESQRQLHGREHPDLADSLNNLGELLRRKSDYRAAEPLLREALEIIRERQGEEHAYYAETLANLANTVRLRGDPAGAEPLFRRALAITRRVRGEDHLKVASMWLRLGDSLLAQGKLVEAQEAYGEALRRRRALVPEDWKVSTPLLGLGRVLLAAGDPRGAEEVVREGVLILRRERPGDRRTAEAESLLSDCLIELRRFDEAARP